MIRYLLITLLLFCSSAFSKELVLAWNPSTTSQADYDNATTYYELRFKVNNGEWITYVTAPNVLTFKTDLPLVAGTLLNVQIRAVGGDTFKCDRTNVPDCWKSAWVSFPTLPTPDTNIVYPSTPIATISYTSTTNYSIWNDSTVPNVVSTTDTKAVELGVRFKSDIAGYIKAIKFYQNNLGTYTVSIWNTTKLVSQSHTVTTPGWQTVVIPTLAIEKDIVYVASYYAATGKYAANFNFFTNSIDNPPIHFIQSTTALPNGVFKYGAGNIFPNDSYQAGNYWIDIIFSTTP